jgi:hypothetical protein
MTLSHDIESENNESITKSLDEDINYTIDNELHLDVDNIMYGFYDDIDNQQMEMKKMLHLLVNQLSKQGSQNVFKIKPTSKVKSNVEQVVNEYLTFVKALIVIKITLKYCIGLEEAK